MLDDQMAVDRPLLVLHDPEEGHLVYDLILLSSGQDETLACVPHAVARFPLPTWCCSFAVSGGTVLCAKYDWWEDTLFHDTVMKAGGYGYWERQHISRQIRDSEGRLVRYWPPGVGGFGITRELGDSHKSTPAMIPMKDGSVIRMDIILFDGIYNFDTLRRLPDGSWQATPIPKPPIGPLPEKQRVKELALISAYFAQGTRVWISVERKGTFSLDTERGAWRIEGTWQLPFQGRALYVPELDSVFGFTDGSRQLLCAVDIKTGAPPVMRYVWRDSFPWPWEECVNEDGHHPDTRPRDLPSLAYLGNGRFCICRPMSTMEPKIYGTQITYNASSFLVVEVMRLPGGDLHLAKRGKMSYMWPPQGRQCRYIGLIQPAI